MDFFRKNYKKKFSEIHSNLFIDSKLNSDEKYKYLRSELESFYEKSSFMNDKSPSLKKTIYNNLKTLLTEVTYTNSRLQQTEALTKILDWYNSKIPNKPQYSQSPEVANYDTSPLSIITPLETRTHTPISLYTTKDSFESINKKLINQKHRQIQSSSRVQQQKSFLKDWATLKQRKTENFTYKYDLIKLARTPRNTLKVNERTRMFPNIFDLREISDNNDLNRTSVSPNLAQEINEIQEIKKKLAKKQIPITFACLEKGIALNSMTPTKKYFPLGGELLIKSPKSSKSVKRPKLKESRL